MQATSAPVLTIAEETLLSLGVAHSSAEDGNGRSGASDGGERHQQWRDAFQIDRGIRLASSPSCSSRDGGSMVHRSVRLISGQRRRHNLHQLICDVDAHRGAIVNHAWRGLPDAPLAWQRGFPVIPYRLAGALAKVIWGPGFIATCRGGPAPFPVEAKT